VAGYHNRDITKGKFGEISKIEEEFEELLDAVEQDAKIMIVCELADLYGAISAYVEKHHNLTMEDIKKMSDLTKRAFEDGTRKAASD
jgi:phosphoribosyl-ATP pyrophosphohydrolase